jgi:hypothetical protein
MTNVLNPDPFCIQWRINTTVYILSYKILVQNMLAWGSVNENTNLSSDEEEVSEPESEILAPETEGGVGEGIVEAVTEKAMNH